MLSVLHCHYTKKSPLRLKTVIKRVIPTSRTTLGSPVRIAPHGSCPHRHKKITASTGNGDKKSHSHQLNNLRESRGSPLPLVPQQRRGITRLFFCLLFFSPGKESQPLTGRLGGVQRGSAPSGAAATSRHYLAFLLLTFLFTGKRKVSYSPSSLRAALRLKRILPLAGSMSTTLTVTYCPSSQISVTLLTR